MQVWDTQRTDLDSIVLQEELLYCKLSSTTASTFTFHCAIQLCCPSFSDAAFSACTKCLLKSHGYGILCGGHEDTSTQPLRAQFLPLPRHGANESPWADVSALPIPVQYGTVLSLRSSLVYVGGKGPEVGISKLRWIFDHDLEVFNQATDVSVAPRTPVGVKVPGTLVPNC